MGDTPTTPRTVSVSPSKAGEYCAISIPSQASVVTICPSRPSSNPLAPTACGVRGYHVRSNHAPKPQGNRTQYSLGFQRSSVSVGSRLSSDARFPSTCRSLGCASPSTSLGHAIQESVQSTFPPHSASAIADPTVRRRLPTQPRPPSPHATATLL